MDDWAGPKDGGTAPKTEANPGLAKWLGERPPTLLAAGVVQAISWVVVVSQPWVREARPLYGVTRTLTFDELGMSAVAVSIFPLVVSMWAIWSRTNSSIESSYAASWIPIVVAGLVLFEAFRDDDFRSTWKFTPQVLLTLALFIGATTLIHDARYKGSRPRQLTRWELEARERRMDVIIGVAVALAVLIGLFQMGDSDGGGWCDDFVEGCPSIVKDVGPLEVSALSGRP